VTYVFRREVANKISIAKRVANSIEDENGDNQKGKDVVGEAGGISGVASQFKESGQSSVNTDPHTDPCVKGKKRDAAPIWISVLRPYTAPKVSVGAITEIDEKRVKLVISESQCVPMVVRKSSKKPLPHGLPGSVAHEDDAINV